MRQMPTAAVLILLFLASAERAAQAAAPVLRPGDVPIGWLGHPLGAYLTIEGRRAEGFKTGVRTLLVDTINGTKLDKPIPIWIDNLDLPEGMRCIVKGYETMRMIGDPPAREQAAKEAGKSYLPPQAGWQVHCYFVAIKVMNRLQLDPVAAVRTALPEGWSILRVEENRNPVHRPEGKGKAIYLVAPNRVDKKSDYDAVIYIMPADYEDGGEDPTHGQAQVPPARLLIDAADAKIYVWPPGTVTGWQTFREDLFKALFD